MSQQPEKVPNEITLQAMRDAEQGQTVPFDSPIEQWLDSLNTQNQIKQ